MMPPIGSDYDRSYNSTVINEKNKEQISVDVPIVSKNLQRNVLLGITAVAFAALYYTVIRPPLMFYNADITRIQNTIKCMENEPKVSSMPGCRDNVYCSKQDSGFRKFYPFYRTQDGACINDATNILFSKDSAESTISDYRNSTSYAKQLFDRFYFKTVVRLTP